MLKHRLILIIVLASLVSGCAAGRAYRRGQEAARAGDWDAAVTHLTTAVQEQPDKAEYKIALERAMQTAAREHISRAFELEQKDQIDGALIEYRRALELDASNRLAASRAAELERTIRDRIEKSRPKPPIDKLREQARAQSVPMLNPANREPIKLTFNNASLRDILNTIGQLTGKITTLTIARVSQGISRELREKVEGEVAAQAIARYRARAAEVSKQFGYGGYTVREVHVNTEVPPGGPVPMLRAKAMSAAADESLPIEAGKGTVTVTVNGTVQMTR